MKPYFDIFNCHNSQQFTQTALAIFHYQYHNNSTYQQFCNLLRVNPTQVTQLTDIPFLPVDFFKSHTIVTGNQNPEIVFTSSGTTGLQTSKHPVLHTQLYIDSFTRGFEYFYGHPNQYAILALLPSYMEREGSSLLYMVERLIEQSKHPKSGFYLHNYSDLADTLTQLEQLKQPTLLIGVTYALINLVEHHKLHLNHTTVMETGGMKGKRKEMIREELHKLLENGLGVSAIHSEYGMTELLSQAYSKGEGIFETPPWMQILIRDPEDPLQILPYGKTGGINVIDLANYNSCSFIATQDLGKLHTYNTFEVLGRFDFSDIRGCNLMVSN